MGTQTTELKGPDLADGIELSELSDGKPLLAHARGEALVVVRRGDDVFVTGATCTHYSGPLAEGLVVGATIRCPWHHACFSLETGEAIGAPALSPSPCYSIVRRGTKVSLGEKREPPHRSLDASSVPKSVVVLGAGAAGAAAVEALRREGYRGPLTLVGDEAPGPVDRPNLSKDYLAGTAPEEWIPLRSPEFYAELNVEFVLGDPRQRVDPGARQVVLKSGRELAFGALLLATGRSPKPLDVPGADLPHVHVLRTLADSRAIIARARGQAPSGGDRLELHRARGRGVAAAPRDSRSKSLLPTRFRSRASSATSSGVSCRASTKSTACASASAESRQRSRRTP